jgi:hypothetical protein
MYFLLHHSTGALMLDAADRDEVLSWSERQLGSRAGVVSVLQLEEQAPDLVERSGTGIVQANASGCEARLSFMADSVQRVVGLEGEVIKSFEWYRTANLGTCKASVH